MKFTKMQGTGNDFVVVEASQLSLDWPELAKKICDRRLGIGADGLILALPPCSADIRMRIFNADGSEAEMCGNGIRCLTKFVLLKGLIKKGARVIGVETIPGIRKVRVGYEGKEIKQIQVGMGQPILKANDIPVNPEPGKAHRLLTVPVMDYPLMIGGLILALNFVSMGNPHAVYFTSQDLKEFPITRIGPAIENYPAFPKRINFEVARVLDRKTIEMRVWERGSGETLACGTGACAVAVAARLHGYSDDLVDIILPGGILNIEWDGKGEVLMSGPAEIVFQGEWPEAK